MLFRSLAAAPFGGDAASTRRTGSLALDTYYEITDEVGCSFKASSPSFEVVHAGDDATVLHLWRRPLLPPPRPGHGARLPWLEVTGSGDGVRLERGAPLGALPGTTWAIYPDGETDFRNDALAIAEVVALDGPTAELGLGDVVPRRILTGCRAVQILEADTSSQPRVMLALPLEQQAEARAILRRLAPGTQLVPEGPEQLANFVVSSETIGTKTRYEVYAGDRQIVIGVRGTAPEAIRVVGRSMAADSLLSLRNPTSELRVRTWTAYVGDEFEGRKIKSVKQVRGNRRPTGTPYRTYREGDAIDDRNCLQLFIAAEQDCYITVVNIDGEGAIGLLFPGDSFAPDFLPDGFVSGGAEVRIPDSLDAERSRAGDNLGLWTAGRENVRVFATEDLGTAELIRDSVRRIEQHQKENPDDLNTLQELIRGLRDELSQVAGRRIRGLKKVSNRPRRDSAAAPNAAATDDASSDTTGTALPIGDWTATTISFTVEESR